LGTTRKIKGSLFLVLAIIFSVLGVLTLLPTSILPWSPRKPCFLGYYALCTWAPLSSIILFGLSAGLFLPLHMLFSESPK